MAAIAQLGERQTEDLKVPGSIPGLGMYTQLYLRVAGVSSWATISKGPQALASMTLCPSG